MSPLVSIGIITHNRLQFLKEAIESALSQETDIPYEVLIVNNASTDKTDSFLASLSNPQIKVITSEANLGEAGGRNLAVSHMKGEYAIWLDDDDLLLPNALASQCSCLTAHPKADIIYGNLKACNTHGEIIEDWPYRSYDQRYILYTLLFYSAFPNGGTLIKKSSFESAGLYDTRFSRAADYDFWIRAAVKGADFVHNDEFVYLYRAHSGNFLRGEDSPSFNDCGTLAMTRLLSEASLDRIFPMYDWQKRPKAAKAAALLSISLMYCKYGRFERAMRFISESNSLHKSKEAQVVHTIIHLVQNHKRAAVDELLQKIDKDNESFRRVLQMTGLIPPD